MQKTELRHGTNCPGSSSNLAFIVIASCADRSQEVLGRASTSGLHGIQHTLYGRLLIKGLSTQYVDPYDLFKLSLLCHQYLKQQSAEVMEHKYLS